jgi:ferredoxin
MGCGDCNAYCQFHALEVVDSMNQVIYENCMGCGVCVSKCEHDALSLIQDPTKGIPLEICSLMKEAVFTE